jgi:hypothetical protein
VRASALYKGTMFSDLDVFLCAVKKRVTHARNEKKINLTTFDCIFGHCKEVNSKYRQLMFFLILEIPSMLVQSLYGYPFPQILIK